MVHPPLQKEINDHLLHPIYREIEIVLTKHEKRR